MRSTHTNPPKWIKGTLLGLSIALGTGTGVLTYHPRSVHAETARAQESAAVYNQFEKLVKSPAMLAQARNYLINHINEAGVWRGTIMTLHLENAQKAYLNSFSEKMYPEKVQKAIDSAFREKKYDRNQLTYTYLLSVIKDTSIRRVLTEARDKGYKIETSEGMYYPVMHYEGFKVFKPDIQKDIADYIDIMAKESNKPTIFDAAIVIPWEELISRALEKEAFLSKYPTSNRTPSIKNNLYIDRVFLGSSNTPAFEYDKPTRIEQDLRKAYESAISQGIGDSRILKSIDGLLKLLDKTNNVLNSEVESYIEAQIKLYAN